MTPATLTLSELLSVRWKTEPASIEQAREAALAADRHRSREQRLLGWIPEPIVRRLDRGFARSNTVHPNTGQALYSIVRAVRPMTVLETGTYWGYSTAFLAGGVKDNGTGHVVSVDLDAEAGKHLPDGLRPYVTLHRGKPASEVLPDVLGGVAPEIFFQDSVHDYEGVLAELERVAPLLQRDAVVLFHDFVADGVREAAVAGLPGWKIFHLTNGDPQQLGVALQWI